MKNKIVIAVLLVFLNQYCFGSSELGCNVLGQEHVNSYQVSAVEPHREFKTLFSLCKLSKISTYVLILELTPNTMDFVPLNEIQDLSTHEKKIIQTNLKSEVWIKKLSLDEYSSLDGLLDHMYRKQSLADESPAVDSSSYCFFKPNNKKNICFSIPSSNLDKKEMDNIFKIQSIFLSSFPAALNSSFKGYEVNYFDYVKNSSNQR